MTIIVLLLWCFQPFYSKIIILSSLQIGIDHAFDLEHFQVINARILQITATPMHTAFTILLKSKKPLPVTVIAQAIAKMVMRTKAILITFRMTPFFTQSRSFINFRFVNLFYYSTCKLIHNKKRATNFFRSLSAVWLALC